MCMSVSANDCVPDDHSFNGSSTFNLLLYNVYGQLSFFLVFCICCNGIAIQVPGILVLGLCITQETNLVYVFWGTFCNRSLMMTYTRPIQWHTAMPSIGGICQAIL